MKARRDVVTLVTETDANGNYAFDVLSSELFNGDTGDGSQEPTFVVERGEGDSRLLRGQSLLGLRANQ